MNTNKHEDSQRKQAFLPSLRLNLAAASLARSIRQALALALGRRSMMEDRRWQSRTPLHHSILSPVSAILALSFSALSTPALSVSPYNGIMDRNVFGLKAPPPPPDPSANKPPELPSNIVLTGITTILGNKRALLKVTVPARPPEPAKDESYMLTEGQRDGSVEVLEINERAGSVKVNNAGQVTLLTFDKNGAKPVASAAPAGGLPVPRQIPFPALPGAPGSAGTPGGTHPIPTRTVRTGQADQGNSASGANIGSGNYGQTAAAQPAVPYEEQVLMIEAQRMHLQDQGKTEDAAIYPITDLTPGAFGNQENLSPQ